MHISMSAYGALVCVWVCVCVCVWVCVCVCLMLKTS